MVIRLCSACFGYSNESSMDWSWQKYKCLKCWKKGIPSSKAAKAFAHRLYKQDFDAEFEKLFREMNDRK